MNLLKKYGKALLVSISILFILTFVMTLLNYINLIKYNTLSIFKIAIFFLTVLGGALYIGKNSSRKGWFEGIKFGLIFLIILVLFNYLGFNIKFEFKNLLYYIIVIISSILGSMIGINLKK